MKITGKNLIGNYVVKISSTDAELVQRSPSEWDIIKVSSPFLPTGLIIPVKPSTTYTLTCNANMKHGGTYFEIGHVPYLVPNFDVNVWFAVVSSTRYTYYEGLVTSNHKLSRTFTTLSDAKYIWVGVYNSGYYSARITNIQLEEGSTATEFEPYWEIDIPEEELFFSDEITNDKRYKTWKRIATTLDGQGKVILNDILPNLFPPFSYVYVILKENVGDWKEGDVKIVTSSSTTVTVDSAWANKQVEIIYMTKTPSLTTVNAGSEIVLEKSGNYMFTQTLSTIYIEGTKTTNI